MFTGLIQTVGQLTLLDPEHVQVECPEASKQLILSGLEIGDSVAVDGVCLTVTEILGNGFVADISPETLQRSTLATARTSAKAVNLETSLRVGSKLGGHFVTGHVDGLGHLKSTTQTASSWELTFTTDSSQVARYILSKGSIAINGISLTVADCNDQGNWFMVAVIPHTYAETNLYYLRPGNPVNLEGDILGKYVEKFMRSPHANHDITPNFLAEHGYL
ncbi:riboflavin synthase [filamentous cyanobacterium LEGE 11480]|uniref:Riboflavin synthase n=1 Tax=Romeriopsis navalis LEGE 11480 TaxID=2777977 RepID=A0A928VH31_9CYAN|nr:riboflavin synthase [Romeriopsis navalis]MBE9028483.1 riboflavin synthase [Romeriopsis navalis LEGE 11480]